MNPSASSRDAYRQITINGFAAICIKLDFVSATGDILDNDFRCLASTIPRSAGKGNGENPSHHPPPPAVQEARVELLRELEILSNSRSVRSNVVNSNVIKLTNEMPIWHNAAYVKSISESIHCTSCEGDNL